MKKRIFRDYQEKLMKDLQYTKLAQEYLLNPDPKIFLLALKNIYEAQGTEITQLAHTTKLNRENL